MIGTQVQHYRIAARLGGGGMGEVFLGEDVRLGRRVALKFLSPALQTDPEARTRLLTEARAASALRSPYIAVTFDIGEHEGRAFIAMEYVEGHALSDRLRGGPLPVASALRIAVQVADALEEAHAHGIVHRDIKTANLMVNDRGFVKVLDFGLAHVAPLGGDVTFARITAPGIVLGTVSYMAPEQATGLPVDGRADLFSLGVVLFEMLTGQLPFGGATASEILANVLSTPAPAPSSLRPEITPEIDAVVRRALEKDPAHRFQSATQMRDVLDALVSGMPAPATGPSAGNSSRVTIAECCAIAVMTFANITGERADDWIGSGIAETVTSDLKNVQGVTVISRARIYDAIKHLSSLEHGPVNDSVAVDIGRRLGATWVITGGYQRLGGALRITAQFLESRTGALMKTVKLDGRIEDIFALQDRIVFELLQGMNREVGSGEIAGIEQPETRSVDAYEAYSRGIMNLRLATRESMDRAIALFERATTLDPGYAEAWAALGAAHDYKGSFMGVPEMLQQAIEFERRALALDPSNARAHAWLGGAYLGLGRYDEAIASIRHAVRLEPDNASTRSALARAYWIGKGQIEQAITEFVSVVAMNPEAGYAYLQLALLLSLRGRLDEAEQAARQAVDLQERMISGSEGMQVVGARARLGYVYYLQGRYEDAIAQYERELAFLGAGDHLLRERATIEVAQKLGAAWLRKGRRDDAQRYFDFAVKLFEERVAKGADDPQTRYYMAVLEALRGDADRAVTHLERSFAGLPAISPVRARLDPDLDALRGHDRFIALLAAAVAA
jgi:serine/threonine protein kinase/tetratricopeptide (TPR) repeat protein